MKKIIIVIAAILVMAPFHSQAATRPSDAQILKMRATCKGVQCDFIPMTTEELKRAELRDATTTPQVAAGSFAKVATSSEKALTSKEAKAVKKLEKQIASLQKKLEKLEAKRLLLLGQ